MLSKCKLVKVAQSPAISLPYYYIVYRISIIFKVSENILIQGRPNRTPLQVIDRFILKSNQN